jgi:hypothetical protein
MKPEKPTEKQIANAQQIATKLGRAVPDEVIHSELKIRMWINSMKGRLTEIEQKAIIQTKMYEQMLTAIAWYQEETFFERITCPRDSAILEGAHALGYVYLRCPVCDFQTRQIPQHIIKLFKEAHHADETK